MAAKRQWKAWPKRLGQEINGASGAVTLGGTIVTAVSVTTLTGVAAIATGGVGILIAGAAAGRAVWKSIPPKLLGPEELVGKRLRLDELENVNPPLLRLCVVGPSETGKTTLVNIIRAQAPPDHRTQGVHAYVIPLQTNPLRFIAVLDGAGQMYADQFTVAAPAHFLCAMLDHNRSHTEDAIDPGRISAHTRFLEQLRGYLSNERNEPVPRVHILLNKRDLWENAPEQEQAQLKSQISAEVEAWRNSNLAGDVTHMEHSNLDDADVAEFLRLVEAFILERNG